MWLQNAAKLGTSNSCAFLSSIYLGRVAHGFFLAALSTTLLFLAKNVNEDVGKVSLIFTGAGVGNLLGSILSSFVMKAPKPLLLIGLGMFFWGVMMIILPFVQSLVLLIVVASVACIPIGIFDAGGQGLILTVWGEKQSRMYIQAYHFAFTIGAVLAPIIANFFFSLSNKDNYSHTECHRTNTSTDENFSNGNFAVEFRAIDGEAMDPVVFAYVAYASVTILSSLFILILVYKNIIQKITQKRIDKCKTSESRVEKPLQDSLPLFIVFTIFLFSLAGADHPMFSYIFAVAVCSDLQFTEERAAILSSLFWCGYGAGRLIAIWLSKHIQPKCLISTSLFGCMLSLVLFSAVGENKEIVAWIGTFGYGIFSAPLYPSFVSWMFKYFNLSGKYVFITTFGNTIGAIVMVTVSGIVFQNNPFAVIYVSTAMIGFASAIFLAIVLTGKKHARKTAQAKGSPAEKEKTLG